MYINGLFSFVVPHSNPLLILDRFYWNDKICGQHLFLLDVKTKDLKELHVPRVTDSDMGFKIVGSCNGLVCVTHYSLDPTSTLLLWNPATIQTKRILEAQNPFMPHKVPPNCLIGFYFDYNDFDYHVVRLHSFGDTESSCWGDSLSRICVVRVEKYSLRTGLWREIECSDPLVRVNGALFWTENFVTVEGALFWVAMEVSEKVSHEMIISFNSCNDVLSKIEMPGSDKDCSEVYKKLLVYKGLVAVVICSETKSMEQCLHLWALYDKYEGVKSWTKLQTIGMFSRLERPVGIWKNEVLMATNKAIHSVSGIIALLPESDLEAEFSYNVFNYVESFIPLYSGNLMVENAYPIESEGFSLHDMLMKDITMLSIGDNV
ncbi:F-box/kelch-repeat protein At3g06240-like [Gastrolobium bilobum]|uniref:F-box/kelch-repeat protein At3g06240-like n=1 Tax=Gastrolobium bilobum TaxID=150636 RepID=UPI002AB2E23C|nr:F-box/kelch-repeat protein At3g06240-like [Gastrolobium bilobum]